MNKIDSILRDIEALLLHFREGEMHFREGKKLFDNLTSDVEEIKNGNTPALTATEQEIYALLLQGIGLDSIAEKRKVSVRTVEKQRDMIKRKFGFKKTRDFNIFLAEKRKQ